MPLIKGCKENNAKCKKEVYHLYRGFAFKVAFRYIYAYDKATDIVNDSFVKMFTHFNKFNGGDEDDIEKILMGWLKKIVINTSIDYLRKQQMSPEIGGIQESAFETTDNVYNADQVLLYNDLIKLVKKLPPSYRVVFNMYVIDGYSHAEIADILNIPIGTSKSHLSRARAILQKQVRKMEEEHSCRI